MLKVIQGIATLDKSRLEKLRKILKSTSLYTRNEQEFDYTYKILTALISPIAVKKYFKDANIVNFDELMDGNELKPAGISPKDESSKSIYGVIASWSSGKSSESKKDGTGNASKGNSFTSFEEVKQFVKPVPGQQISINAEFKYDPKYDNDAAKHWRPVKLRR